ncbi:MAG: Hsp20/alpha crystallin family protein [Bacillota bacterium]|nr:Hsp20/alpha crystallin family protein [Bacillota bacterium]
MVGLVPFNRNRVIDRNGFKDIYDMLDDFFSDTLLPRKSLINGTFKLDVKESDDNYQIEAELPGIKKEEINVKMNNERLTINIDKEEEIDESEKNYIHKERHVCSMNRTIYLADAMDDEIKAKLDDGVLTIIVPKHKKSKNAYTIEIE